MDVRNPEELTMAERKGPFWDIVEGRLPTPPASMVLGWKPLAVAPEHGTITVEFHAKPEFVNAIGHVQGGFLVAMLDDTLGPALVATLAPGQFAPTLELKVNFIHPAPVGRLIGEGKVVHRGRTVAVLQGELRTPEGQLIATATATASIQSRA
jgi:uncharacterized protein (TIGR00369 family)